MRKGNKVKEEGESPPSTRRSRPSQNDVPSLCATHYTFGGVGELYRRRSPFAESFRCADHRSIRIGDEREWLAAASPVMTKSRGLSWGRNNYPENGLVIPPRRDTRTLQPSRHVRRKGAAPLSGAEEQTAHSSGGICAVRLLTFFANVV